MADSCSTYLEIDEEMAKADDRGLERPLLKRVVSQLFARPSCM